MAALRAAGIEGAALLHVVNLEDNKNMNAIQLALRDATGAGTVPRVFVDAACIGGGEETLRALRGREGGAGALEALAALAAAPVNVQM